MYQNTLSGILSNMKRTLIATLSCLALAACSKSDTTFKTVDDMAKKAGCSTFTKDSGQLELGVQESGTCVIDGKDVRLMVFADNGKRDTWAGFPSVSGTTLKGDKWIVNSDDSAAAHKAESAIK